MYVSAIVGTIVVIWYYSPPESKIMMTGFAAFFYTLIYLIVEVNQIKNEIEKIKDRFGGEK
jgi:hypothetical protein